MSLSASRLRVVYRAVCALALGALAACRPTHAPAPLPGSQPDVVEAQHKAPPSPVKVAVFEPSGSGNWNGTIDFSPAPAAAVASCITPGAAGWVSVEVETHRNEASTTSVVEASSGLADSIRACVANALKGVHTQVEAPTRFLFYFTFSPEAAWARPELQER